MAAINDKKTIYVVKPNVIDDMGNKAINGYKDLQVYKNVLCVPANSQEDIAIYGSEISSIIKFHSNKILDVSVDGGDGIYFDKPTVDENGLYQQPPYISTPRITFRNECLFDGKKQVY